jgi:hypothetical protein
MSSNPANARPRGAISHRVDAHPEKRLTNGTRLALSRSEAAAALGMSLSHFQRHVRPQVRCIYSGQLRLFPVTELQRWVAENACEGGRAA